MTKGLTHHPDRLFPADTLDESTYAGEFVGPYPCLKLSPASSVHDALQEMSRFGAMTTRAAGFLYNPTFAPAAHAA